MGVREKSVCWGLRASIVAQFSLPLPAPAFRVKSVSNLAAVRVATGLTQPLFVTAPPGDFERLFIVQQDGGIRILNLVTGALNPTPFLTLNGVRVGGDKVCSGWRSIQTMPPTESSILISLFRAARLEMASLAFLNSRSRQIRTSPIRVARKSFSASTILRPNHNGGWVAFSPRANDANNLYVATGDGGAGNDAGSGHIEPGGNAQSKATLLGKMLRIHVNSAAGTASVPPDNPFIGLGRRQTGNLGLWTAQSISE